MIMKKVYLFAISALLFSCGPSETEVKEHEEKRDSVETQAEENWEDDMDAMMEETPDSSKSDSIK